MVVSLVALYGALGLVLGSFANVLIHRIPRRESIVSPGSRCPACGTPILWYHNIPVVSWLILGGRCAACRGKISPRYPLVEAAMGVLFALCGWRWGATPDGAAASLFCLLCLSLALIDLEHHLLPDRLTYPGIALGLVLSPFTGWCTWPQALIGALLGALIPASIIGLYALFHVDAMGWGDVKFLAMIGAFLGWKGMVLTLVGGALLGAVGGGAYLLVSGKGRRTPLPFGSFLGTAALFSLFFSPPLWAWYLSLLFPAVS